MASQPILDPEQQLIDFVAQFVDDPYGFVLSCFPWGEKGTSLEKHEGPDKWQVEFLIELGRKVKANAFDGSTPVMPIRMGASSGHGPGKTTMAAWLVCWIMSTRPRSRGTVTANKWDQLQTKTWPAVRKWVGLCITKDWFDISGAGMRAKDPNLAALWFCNPANSKKEHSESFSGQHAEDATSFYIFDEDSGIEDEIHEVAEGGLTDGEPMMFIFGNPTRNSGFFHRACFGSLRSYWTIRCLDARESKFTNKQLIKEWIEIYGEDSDFVRVRVKGLPPNASDLQFIDQERIYTAQRRPLAMVFEDEPLVAGVDVSDGGSAWNVVRFRRGLDARSIPPVRIPGEKVRGDRSMFLAVLADVLTKDYNGHRVSAMFIDSAFGAPYVERLQAMGYRNVHEVRFGSPGPDRHQANMRAHMWQRMKDWLGKGCVDPTDQRLETDLGAPGYHLDRQDRLVIESKEDMAKRGVASPDDGDALALSFSAAVQVPRKKAVYSGSIPREFQWT